MADPDDESNGQSEQCKSCEDGRIEEKKDPIDLKFVELNADEGDVSEMSEEDRSSASPDGTQTRPKKKVKKKRRSKSFNSNEEETSSSDEDVTKIVIASKRNKEEVNLNDLSWTMWVWFYIVAVSSGAFHFAEYLGEKLADLFGITSPKYQYVIDEYYRQKQEEEEEKEAVKREEEYVQNKKLETLSQLEVGKEQERPAEP